MIDAILTSLARPRVCARDLPMHAEALINEGIRTFKCVFIRQLACGESFSG